MHSLLRLGEDRNYYNKHIYELDSKLKITMDRFF